MEALAGGRVHLHCGDCVEVLASFPECSVDAVVTDPPYHLQSIHKRFAAKGRDETSERYAAGPYGRHASGFMGQKWDGGDVAFQVETWAAVLRVLRPGGYLLAMGGTRTHHRLACAIEDAGFEIRDMVAWLYGSGFPKSHDVGKAVDRMLGVEREQVRHRPRLETSGTFCGSMDTRPWIEKSREVGYHDGDSDTPASWAARQWNGWGTALKPALEPICLARRPLDGTIARNVMVHGTGALNIDGCRVESEPIHTTLNTALGLMNDDGWQAKSATFENHPNGRWPANVVLSFPENEYILRSDVTDEQKRELYRWLSENP